MNTYNFRAECLIDVYTLLTSIQSNYFQIESPGSLDCHVTIKTHFSKDQLLEKIDLVCDGHVMARTLNEELLSEEIIYKFKIGDIVYDKTHKCYGVVLNNYGDPINGLFGEIRLDSDGNQSIRCEDGYNIVPFGSPGDCGDSDLSGLIDSALKTIPYDQNYYMPIYSKKLLNF